MFKWLKKIIRLAAARQFEDFLEGIPRGKPCSLWFEMGEFDEQTDEYPFEGMAPLYLAPDGSVWARICDSVSELPAIKEC
jgi:hypothetical protein